MFSKIAKARKIVVVTIIGTTTVIALLAPQFAALAGNTIGGV